MALRLGALLVEDRITIMKHPLCALWLKVPSLLCHPDPLNTKPSDLSPHNSINLAVTKKAESQP